MSNQISGRHYFTVSKETFDHVQSKKQGTESADSCLRRIMGLPPKQKAETLREENEALKARIALLEAENRKAS